MARDTNFYYSFLVLTPAKRQAIIAVWDFCRAVDDAVDEVGEAGDAAVEVARWRREVADCFEGRAPQTRQGRALAPAHQGVRSHARSRSSLSSRASRWISRPRRYETFDDLYQYCIRVASAVGLMCLEIFGYRNPASRQYATDLGVALQLTNILRDVRGDLERGRIYIPLADLASARLLGSGLAA